MTDYLATITWQRNDADFLDDRYSRAHRWSFDGGVEINASSSPQVVPVPMSEAAAVDPEEAFVASLSSCHMLWFLALARKRGFIVERYSDDAIGVMGKNASAKLAMTVVTLRPCVVFVGDKQPDRAQLDHLHESAHAQCFIANSVLTEVRCEPVIASTRE